MSTSSRRTAVATTCLLLLGCSSRETRAAPADAGPVADARMDDEAAPAPRDAGLRTWPDAGAPEERETVDASVLDAGSDEDEVNRSMELAPPCERPEPDPALAVAGPASFLGGGFPIGDARLLHAVVADDAHDRAEILHSAQGGGDDGPVRWRVARVGASGELESTAVVDDFPTEYPSHGGAVRARDGSLLIAWRGVRPRMLGSDAFVGLLDANGALLDGPTMHGSAVPHAIAASSPQVLGDGTEVLVSWMSDGIVASAIGRPGRLVVPTPVAPGWASRAHALDADRFVVSWSDPNEAGHVRTRVAIASLDGGAVQRTLFSDGDYTTRDAAVAVYDGDVWVARFERRHASLAESVIRVAHLDERLARVERDRWLGGWGGTAPQSLELVVFEGRLWLVWVANDLRYGLSVVVHASPVPSPACGRDVGAAVIELPRSWATPVDLRAGASRDRIWVAVGSPWPTNEANAYALTPVE
ncbi:MAG: hypothetical protein IT379_02100 [Deltaproteobacteria bacterium]|nr:hypothetical protein [Deltaproteobacteria bacterium]